MKITQELASELVKEDNLLQVLYLYSVYENGNLRHYAEFGNRKVIIDTEVCLN